jgi:alpha/beta superfamily hydrolase
MNSKIVFQLYKIFVKNGFSTIRFNFRGVGKSEGIFDDGEGGLNDAASVLDWLQQYNANSNNCWIAGFSFVMPSSIAVRRHLPPCDQNKG